MDTTRKSPRTLQEAFGPYAHGSQLQAPCDPTPKEDKIVVVASLIGLAVVATFALVGWL